MHLQEMVVVPADPWTTARLLADTAFVERVARASGAHPLQVDVAGEPAGAFVVTSRRTVPTDQVPPHLRGLVGQHVEVRQVESWQAPDDEGARAGAVAVEVVGAPVRLTGTATLVAHGPAATAVRYAGELRASVPLFGAAVEAATAGAVRGALAVIARVAADELADRDEADEAP